MWHAQGSMPGHEWKVHPIVFFNCNTMQLFIDCAVHVLFQLLFKTDLYTVSNSTTCVNFSRISNHTHNRLFSFICYCDVLISFLNCTYLIDSNRLCNLEKIELHRPAPIRRVADKNKLWCTISNNLRSVRLHKCQDECFGMSCLFLFSLRTFCHMELFTGTHINISVSEVRSRLSAIVRRQ